MQLRELVRIRNDLLTIPNLTNENLKLISTII